ncbi:c-type cytochrome [Hydrogenimonas sp.]|uniref:c-type cytochrome n=1 Tax=Hydrogenimonas sp. TaxID=2231112 RepID=UPI0026143811|nr:c-type cytochrome [Hydrogenimonas sp.]
MKKIGLLAIALVTAGTMTLGASTHVKDAASVYKNRCANCHGDKANGVPKITPAPGVDPREADAKGIVSEESANVYGPPLNGLSKEELLKKLDEIRNGDFDSESTHAAMRKNLEEIEKREGKISDEAMAEYIYNTFGPGSE